MEHRASSSALPNGSENMSPNKIGKIPDFSDEGTEPVEEKGIEEEKKAPAEEAEEEEKVTPAELPAEEKPDETSNADEEEVEPPKEEVVDDTGAKRREQGLLREIEKLRKEKAELRKKEFLRADEPLIVPKEKVEDLAGVNPADIELIDKVIKAKGYVQKDEFQKINYESVKNDELTKFLEKYPEYKPENDSNDTNWNALQSEISLYKMPADPRKVGEILERAHKGIQRSFSERTPNNQAKKRAVEIASHGGGGAQRSSSKGHLTDWQKEQYRKGGWSEEDIVEMDN